MSSGGNGYFTYNSELDAFTLYHQVQEGSTRDYGGPALPALGHALAGGIASALSKAIVYPIDTIVTRMQVQKGLKGEKETKHAASDADAEYKDPIDAARKIYKHEGGIQAFYTGLSSDVVKHIADAFLFFLAYQSLRERMLKGQSAKQLPVHRELGVGMLAGAFSKAITSPIQNVVIRQQTAALSAARNPDISPAEADKQSVRDIFMQIKDEKGIAGFWSGYSAQLVLTLNPAITFAVDNLLRSLIPKKYRDNPTVASTFLVAASSKVLATTITYPVMLAKSRQQASHSSPSRNANSTDQKTDILRRTLLQLSRLVEGQAALLRSLRHIYQHEGVKGLYSGLEGEWVKGFLQHGLTMTVKESVHGSIIQLYFILLKLTKRWPAEFEQMKQNAGAVVQDVQERAENIGVTVAEGVKDVGSNIAEQNASAVVQDVRERAEHVGINVAKGVKDVGSKVTGQNASAVVQDVRERAENIGVTVAEGVKDAGKNVTSQNAGAVVQDVRERAENIGVTVAERAKDVGRKVIGQDE